jgi:hypothetical protein
VENWDEARDMREFEFYQLLLKERSRDSLTATRPVIFSLKAILTGTFSKLDDISFDKFIQTSVNYPKKRDGWALNLDKLAPFLIHLWIE